MHIIFDPEKLVNWQTLFRNQAIQTGHGKYFKAYSQYQRGHGVGSFLRSLFRSVLPLAKSAIPFVKSAGKAVAKQALISGTDLAGDILDGHSIKRAAKRRGRQAGKRIIKKARINLEKLKGQKGKGLRRKVSKKKSKTIKVGKTEKQKGGKKRRVTKKTKLQKGGEQKGGKKRKTRKRTKRDALGIIRKCR